MGIIDSLFGKRKRALSTSYHDRYDLINTIGMGFVLIPAGKFMMGSKEFNCTKPVHKVTISGPFYLGIYPVTQSEWEEVMGTNPSRFQDASNLPVEKVGWDDVQDFVKRLNEKESVKKYRLPTEAEWEYAARAGTATRYSFGNDESKLGDYAWYANNSHGETWVVGAKKPNPWGLYDMHGNVYEWVQDSWHSDYNSAPTDGSSWESGVGSAWVVRGGAWNRDAECCRSAARGALFKGDHSYNCGFRLLRDL
ncbi:serine/threonine kinase [groundwater metagenome]